MAVPCSPLPVCRFAGLLGGSENQLAAAQNELAQWYGRIDDVSEILPFTFTDYYAGEMGENLLRQWVRFEALFSPEHLAKCKLETNMAETLLARQYRETSAAPASNPANAASPIQRPINIDPGYVHRYKVILATTKDHSHRVYIAEGIYAEVTLHWHQNKWTPWPWTYADYQTPQAAAFFERARTAYLDRLQKIAGGH